MLVIASLQKYATMLALPRLRPLLAALDLPDIVVVGPRSPEFVDYIAQFVLVIMHPPPVNRMKIHIQFHFKVIHSLFGTIQITVDIQPVKCNPNEVCMNASLV